MPTVRAARSYTVFSTLRRWMRFPRRYSYASMRDDGTGFEMKPPRDAAPIDVRVDDAGASGEEERMCI